MQLKHQLQKNQKKEVEETVVDTNNEEVVETEDEEITESAETTEEIDDEE